jgi:hypothetical protein
MRNDRMIPGVILVVIGAMFLLFNFGYINFHWENFAILWPLFIIVPGVLLLLSVFKSPWVSGLKAVILIASVGMLLFGNLGGHFRWWPHYHYSYNSNSDDNSDDDDNSSNGAKVINIKGNGEFKEAYKPGMKIARLNVSGGAATYRLNDTTSDLFKADTKEFNGRFEYNGHQEDSMFVMDFKMKNARVMGWGNNGNNANNVYLSLNTRPEWEMTINAGATDLNFDLSKYKVRSVELNGGAGQFVLKMGQPLQNSNIEISTGAADVTIDVPQNAACQIESDTGLSSSTFDGFTKTDEGHYQTAGFDSAANKMFIHISGAISDFKVHKY